MKIEWYPDKKMSEIYQQTGIQFAFLGPLKKGTHQQAHPFVLCRDFLHDAVKAHLNKNKWSIFGFTYEYGKFPPLDMEAMRMLVRKKILMTKLKGKIPPATIKTFNKFRDDMLEYSLRLIHHYEDVGEFGEKSVVDETKDEHGNPVFIFTGSPIWMSSPFLISMYTYLIRLGDKDIVDFKSDDDLRKNYKKLMETFKEFDNDIIYLKKNWDKLHLVIVKRTELFGKDEVHKIYFDKTIQPSGFHNNCGIFNLCQMTSADKNLNLKLKKIVEGTGGKK